MNFNIVDNRESNTVIVSSINVGSFYMQDNKLHIKISSNYSYCIENASYFQHRGLSKGCLLKNVKVIIE